MKKTPSGRTQKEISREEFDDTRIGDVEYTKVLTNALKEAFDENDKVSNCPNVSVSLYGEYFKFFQNLEIT